LIEVGEEMPDQTQSTLLANVIAKLIRFGLAFLHRERKGRKKRKNKSQSKSKSATRSQSSAHKNMEQSKKEKIANLKNNEFIFLELCHQCSDHKIFMLIFGSSSNKF
jgi:hypothetical protein